MFLGVEKGDRQPSFSGNIIAPGDFVRKMGWTFLNGVDHDRVVYPVYGAEMDRYIVVGRDGTVSYVSPLTGFEQGAIDIPTLAREIRAALAVVPVDATTWSLLKTRWR